MDLSGSYAAKGTRSVMQVQDARKLRHRAGRCQITSSRGSPRLVSASPAEALIKRFCFLAVLIALVVGRCQVDSFNAQPRANIVSRIAVGSRARCRYQHSYCTQRDATTTRATRPQNARCTDHRRPGPSLDGSLEHAEDNGANEGESDIRSNNAQSPDERTYGPLGTLPWFTSARQEHQGSKAFPAQKVSVAVPPALLPARTPGRMVKNS